MNKNIIFFDIDGTILSHRDFHISDSTKAAIRQARANGHLVFINTGRTRAEIEAEITEVGFDGFVCGCGTYISYQGDTLLHRTIPTEKARKLIKDLRENQIDAVLEGSEAIYYDNQTTHSTLNSIRNVQIYDHHFNVLTWEENNIVVDKFCLFPSFQEGFERFYQSYQSDYDFIHRHKMYEVIPKNYSKASGIAFLINYLNIPHENTYAFGDGPNDHSMLSYVKHSIGMGNCSDDIRDIVSFVTKDVDDRGIAYALQHFSII